VCMSEVQREERGSAAEGGAYEIDRSAGQAEAVPGDQYQSFGRSLPVLEAVSRSCVLVGGVEVNRVSGSGSRIPGKE